MELKYFISIGDNPREETFVLDSSFANLSPINDTGWISEAAGGFEAVKDYDGVFSIHINPNNAQSAVELKNLYQYLKEIQDSNIEDEINISIQIGNDLLKTPIFTGKSINYLTDIVRFNTNTNTVEKVIHFIYKY